MTDGQWTIAELSECVADALAVAYAGQPSGRVREVPDRRTIRWYTTIGLLDRPAAMRGRTALYGRRHLLQLVAVKRLQAQGRPLADIQHQLLAATDSELERIAHLPEGPPPAGAALVSTSALPRGRFWATRPASPPDGQPALLHGIRLNDGVTLLLEGARTPTAAEVAAINAAAGPLLDLVRQLGHASPDDPASPDGHASTSDRTSTKGTP